MNAFYAGGTEEFITVEGGSDFVDGGHNGGGSWPVDVECDSAGFTVVVCQSRR
ncbi:MAG: hypothetical protein P8R42_24705 [Candidatus Binatia bacterium]|nr:hypothetical protein [Candidatus Binatia bacterium]